jgi:RNA polymerase sigma factor (TIGR02999 family)
MKDVTQILCQIEAGDPSVAEQLLPLVYDELRRLAASRVAQESPDRTLDATALVHEAYIRLVDVKKVQHWDSRGHFFAAAAEAMRRILIEQARRRLGPTAGGRHQKVDLSQAELATASAGIDLLALNEALEQLQAVDPRAAQLVKLRFYAGLTRQEAADVLGISIATADNDWAYAKGWLQVALSESDRNEP